MFKSKVQDWTTYMYINPSFRIRLDGSISFFTFHFVEYMYVMVSFDICDSTLLQSFA